MKHDLIFSIPEIEQKEGLTFTEEFPAGEILEDGAGPSDTCAVRLDFSVGGEDILVEGEVRGRFRMPCSRCLTEHSREFEGRFEETYPLTQGTIETKEEVRQTLLVNVPAQSLCRPDCRGLCPRCGKNLNEGPCACVRPVEKRGIVDNAKPKT